MNLRPPVRFASLPTCLFVGTCLASCGVASCGAPSLPFTPAADVVKVYGPWSYCEPFATVSLSRENAYVGKSAALHARSGAPYDLLIVPGYTPAFVAVTGAIVVLGIEHALQNRGHAHA